MPLAVCTVIQSTHLDDIAHNASNDIMASDHAPLQSSLTINAIWPRLVFVVLETNSLHNRKSHCTQIHWSARTVTLPKWLAIDMLVELQRII